MAIATMRRGLAAVTGLGLAGMVAAPAFAQDVLGDLPVIGKPVDGGIGFQPASSPLAHDQQWLDHFVLIIITAVTIFVCLLLLICIVRYNRRANPVPARFTHNTPIEVIWTLVPVLILLAIGAFSLSLLGTFLVRSGVITSVHAFATDPKRGLYILALLVIVIGFSLLLYAMRANKLMGGGSFGLVSRETSLLANNVLLTVASASVLLGTLYPLFLDALGLGKISVGPPYFEAVFVPLMTPVVVLMMFGPFLRWKDDDFVAAVRKVAPAFIASVLIGFGVAWAVDHVTWRTVLGLALSAWVVLASIQLLVVRLKERAGASAGSRLRSITASWWGMWLAHFGVGIFIIGVTLVGSLDQNIDVKMKEGQRAELAGYTFLFRGALDADGPNYDAARGIIELSRDGRALGTLTPEKRVYRAQGMPMTEASLDIGVFRDVYVSLGEQLPDGAWIVSLYYKPFISWIWMGCLLMGLGGVFAASDRRYRRLAAREATAGAGQRAAASA